MRRKISAVLMIAILTLSLYGCPRGGMSPKDQLGENLRIANKLYNIAYDVIVTTGKLGHAMQDTCPMDPDGTSCKVGNRIEDYYRGTLEPAGNAASSALDLANDAYEQYLDGKVEFESVLSLYGKARELIDSLQSLFEGIPK